MVLPLGGDGEQDWPTGVRVILYMIGLGWCFLGVAIVSDTFMGSIEKITAKKRRVLNPKTKKYVTVTVWNETVANLTLMALGSSAPEIMLSIVELLGNDLYSGDLGPSTIVGSAAFNLLCIIAVCISAIREGEVRKIKEVNVYAVTAVFSLLAYVWLIIILTVSSENVVTIVEALITLLLFPVLIVISFLADRGFFSMDGEPHEAPTLLLSENLDKEELAEMELRIRQQHGTELSDKQVERLIEMEFTGPQSRAHYRVNAIRGLTGGKRVSGGRDYHLKQMKQMSKNEVCSAKDTSDELCEAPPNNQLAQVSFATARVAVLENVGWVKLPLVRTGDINQHVQVNYSTREGTAKENTDYEPASGTVDFLPGETGQIISVKIIDDIAYETDEHFYVDLDSARNMSRYCTTVLGELPTCEVLIMDDDDPGQLKFEGEDITVPCATEETIVPIVIQRVLGATGKITCRYFTEDGSALAGLDYEAASGVVIFDCGQMTATIHVTVKARGRYANEELFRVVLKDPTDGARFVEDTDGGSDCCILTVVIQAEQKVKDRLDRMMSHMKLHWDKAQIGHSNWRDQFIDALYVDGGDDDPEPSRFDYVMHLITLPWKLLFAVVPPTYYCGGWLCFGCSLIMIALVTIIVGDMAELLGCVMDIPDEITAITFVALGTSLPDTFASRTAAVMDPTADASVGNVTGSNSVNVFLGLGLPWTIGAIYWAARGSNDKWRLSYPEEALRYPDGAFVVKAGTLVFSVVIFTGCAVVAISFLYVRRRVCGGELGGSARFQLVSSIFMVFLWVAYVIASSWYALAKKDD